MEPAEWAVSADTGGHQKTNHCQAGTIAVSADTGGHPGPDTLQVFRPPVSGGIGEAGEGIPSI